VQHRTPSCQVEHPAAPETSRISAHAGDVDGTEPTHGTRTSVTEFERPNEYSDRHGRGALPTVIAASQWLHATTGRIATCAHSWMTAVHWVAGLAHKGLYKPARTHGPKFGPTTLQIAQEIAGLTECRPSVDYLARKLKVAERTVQYHLGMLREAGLLVYRSKGTRISGVGGRASEFERTIPAAFDKALGIRTVGEGATRRPVGAAQETRKLLGKLAKKAARKVRRRRSKTAFSAGSRCTPMEGGTSASSPAASSIPPSESKLASGKKTSPTPKQQKNRGPRKLNKIGRRYQLAAELIATVPWLAKASRARIAWIVRDFADAGWTALEVWAAAELSRGPAADVRRPSGVLAYRLSPKALRTATPAQRRAMVEEWQDSRAAERARHAEDAEVYSSGPQSPEARQAMAEAVATIQQQRQAPAIETTPAADEQPELRPEDLTRDEIIDLRCAAMQNPALIRFAIEGLGERETRRIYSNRIVDQALALEAIAARDTPLTPAF